MSYRFKTGKLAGMTMEHALLRRPHRVYPIVTWAETEVGEKPRLRPLVREFHRLQKLLNRAEIHARCTKTGCAKPARWMTLELATGGGYLPHPIVWCNKHGPGDPDFESQKMPIRCDRLNLFKTLREKRIFCRQIVRALGIEEGTRITEELASEFFSKIR